MNKYWNLLVNLWKKYKLFILKIPFFIFVLLYSMSKNTITDTEFITYYTFMIGFHIQSYISINMTKKAEVLKENDSFKSIVSIYKKTILSNLIGLIITILTIILSNECQIQINENNIMDVFKLIEIVPFAFSIWYLIILIDSLIKFFNLMEE